MICINSKLTVSDNSGARVVKCIRVYNKKKFGTVGDILLVSILKYNPKKKLKKGELHKAILIRTRAILKDKINYFVFTDNAVILLNKKNLPIATRLFGTTMQSMRRSNRKVFLMIPHTF